MSVRQEELELLETLVTGDAAAWRVFVDRYQGVVFARIARTARDSNQPFSTADLEDICADVFSTLVADNFASLRRFEGRSKISTWLSVIARRVCLRRIQTTTPLSNQDDLNDQQSDREGILSSLIAKEDLDRMRVSLEQLSPADREIVQLYFEQNLSYQEIGQRLGLSTNAVGPKLHRARQRLKKLMGEPIPASQERSKDA